MPQIDALPYLTPSSDSVGVQPWTVLSRGRALSDPESLNDWDPLTNLVVSRTLHLDLPFIFKQCELSRGSELMLCTSWVSTGTKLKERIGTLIYRWGEDACDASMSGEIKGQKLAVSLGLITRLLLKKAGDADGTLSPNKVGAVLWKDERSVRLEGLGARFPVQLVDFATMGWPLDAGWRLSWRQDFNALAMGNIVLFVNSRHERLRSMLTAETTDPQAPAISEAIQFDVAKRLIIGAIESDEFVEAAPDFPHESVGNAIYALMKRFFGEEPAKSLRHRYLEEAAQFDCELQAGLRLFQ